MMFAFRLLATAILFLGSMHACIFYEEVGLVAKIRNRIM